MDSSATIKAEAIPGIGEASPGATASKRRLEFSAAKIKLEPSPEAENESAPAKRRLDQLGDSNEGLKRIKAEPKSEEDEHQTLNFRHGCIKSEEHEIPKSEEDAGENLDFGADAHELRVGEYQNSEDDEDEDQNSEDDEDENHDWDDCYEEDYGGDFFDWYMPSYRARAAPQTLEQYKSKEGCSWDRMSGSDISVRCTNKGELRRTKNSFKCTHYLNFEVMDAEGTRMNAVAFDYVAEQCSKLLSYGKTYRIREFSLNRSKSSFEPGNDLVIDKFSTRIEPCPEGTLPQVSKSFTPIQELLQDSHRNFDDIELLGMVTSIGQEGDLINLQVIDRSGGSIRVEVKEFLDTPFHPNWVKSLPFVVHLTKLLRLRSPGSFRLSVNIPKSMIRVEPDDLPEVDALRNWYIENFGSTS